MTVCISDNLSKRKVKKLRDRFWSMEKFRLRHLVPDGRVTARRRVLQRQSSRLNVTLAHLPFSMFVADICPVVQSNACLVQYFPPHLLCSTTSFVWTHESEDGISLSLVTSAFSLPVISKMMHFVFLLLLLPRKHQNPLMSQFKAHAVCSNAHFR